MQKYSGFTKKQRGFKPMNNGYVSENADLSINEGGFNGMLVGM